MKKLLLAGLIAGLFLVSAVGYANADLVEEDLFTPGDGLLTYDTDTGLYWLDLPVTINLSYNDVLNETGVGGSLEGFWYATTADVDTLQVSAGLPSGLFSSTYYVYVDNMNQLLNLVGLTDEVSNTSFGITSDPFEPTTTIDDRIIRYLSERIAVRAEQGVIDDNVASATIGSWLITDALPDQDGDTIPDIDDNCPEIANENQTDSDVDGVGDVCDNCPATSNTDQIDSDADGTGDICDVCPDMADDQSDIDGDGLGDACDGCPSDINKIDPGICGCNTPDTDSDSDGTADCIDRCPFDANKIDPGQCGCGAPETDTDSDGIADCIDACPLDYLNDADNDLICGDVDNCPDTANADQFDLDGDGIGDACDPDADNDGYSTDDCNDLDDTINPAQCDIKDDGIDQDCDGSDRTKGKPCSSDDGGTDPPPTTEPEGKGITCSDGIDNDVDGFTDCDDSGCATNKSCK